MPIDPPSLIAITGGAGYVGSRLVPRLLDAGYRVRVLDLCWFGEPEAVYPEHHGHAGLELLRADLRDPAAVQSLVAGADAVIHLACVSNDPSFELDPDLGKSINRDAFEPLVDAAQAAGVKRFVYASSSSVYGVSDQPDVTEDHVLAPLTDYSKFKAECEPVLLDRASSDFVPVVVRPATVCGYGPRQRLDVIVNILTNHAYHNRKVKVFGGDQLRPNIHIEDMCRCYEAILAADDATVAGKVWNAGYHNHSVADLAEAVRMTVLAETPDAGPIDVETTPTDDPRSYHINSEKIREELGFEAQHTIEDAVRDLVRAFASGKLPDSLSEPRYFNVQVMQAQPA
ncbi:MAG: SDR family oxidoreductase [Planctomycetota bacterium]